MVATYLTPCFCSSFCSRPYFQVLSLCNYIYSLFTIFSWPCRRRLFSLQLLGSHATWAPVHDLGGSARHAAMLPKDQDPNRRPRRRVRTRPILQVGRISFCTSTCVCKFISFTSNARSTATLSQGLRKHYGRSILVSYTDRAGCTGDVIASCLKVCTVHSTVVACGLHTFTRPR